MQKRTKKILRILTWLILSMSFLLGFFYYEVGYRPLIKVGSNRVKVPVGSDILQLANQLAAQHLIHHVSAFILFAEFHNLAKNLHYGEYAISPGMTPCQLLSNIQRGRGLFRHNMTFIEGRTFQDMLNRLALDPDLRHTLTGKTPEQIMTLLGHAGENPEGRFFPDTYAFIWGNSDAEVLQRAYRKMTQFLAVQWPLRVTTLPYKTSYEALIVASLVERETALPVERPMIAAVILHRLQQNMRLQVDPTILYGLGKSYNAPIMKQDLKKDTPYNTYLHEGLPPTPISMPGGASILAALHPALNTTALYYVSKGDGSHQFSDTYPQHLQAVAAYQKKLASMVGVKHD